MPRVCLIVADGGPDVRVWGENKRSPPSDLPSPHEAVLN